MLVTAIRQALGLPTGDCTCGLDAVVRQLPEDAINIADEKHVHVSMQYTSASSIQFDLSVDEGIIGTLVFSVQPRSVSIEPRVEGELFHNLLSPQSTLGTMISSFTAAQNVHWSYRSVDKNLKTN